ncbi:nuclear transport factor 2 family protein [Novosphingobium sp.]|uniref:nuclear transport factor 2 family protein n=1 Tax=Novosphingobium sp. TaxID=1874826 RepID=UPI003BA99F67
MLFIVGSLLVAGTSPALAEEVDPAVFAPLQTFAEGMSSGEMSRAAIAFAPAAAITDSFAPYHWSSFADWIKDGDRFFKANGVTDFHIALAAPSTTDVTDDHAYAVVPTTETFLANGKPTEEKGVFTFALIRTGSGWRITSVSWSTL